MTPDYLRFDFPFDRALTSDELRAIEDEVRRIIREDRPVSIEYMTMAQAVEGGADAFFDEKYGETVRTIRVQDYSFELCGGTHCRATGQIGGFVITGERSIGSGMRRIEALTGDAADAWFRERIATLERAAEAAGATSTEALPDRIAALQDELRETRRRLREGGSGASPSRRAGGLRRGGRAGRPPCRPRRAVRLDRDPQGRGTRCPRRARVRDHRAGARRRRATGLRHRQRRPRRARHRRRRPRPCCRGPDGRAGGGRPEMAQGKGARREGLAAALEAIRDAVRTNGATGG